MSEIVLRQQRGGGKQDRTVYLGSQRLGFLGPEGRNTFWWIAEMGPGEWRKGRAYSEEQAINRIVQTHDSYRLLYGERKGRLQIEDPEEAALAAGHPVHDAGPSVTRSGDHTDAVEDPVPDRGGQ